jgi:LmbE family N-acetylglucosaminyl deacetylase
MLRFAILITIFSFTIKLFGQTISSSEILHKMHKLEVLGSVLYLAAHPDDENTRAISYLSKGRKYEVAYMSLTRGDGGQNLIGPEQGIELGIIRSNELFEARKIDGAQQFFSRAYDFGYSKTPEETFNIWGENETLEDVVLLIRKFKPDIIINRFPSNGGGGHGHHTASAILGEKAFDLSNNPQSFPNHLTHFDLWQPKRLLWNTYSFGDRNTTAPTQFHTDVGKYDALLGKTYGEIAGQSRSMHSSQGFGSPQNRGIIKEYFKTIKGEEISIDLMDGVNTTWERCFQNSKKGKKQAAKLIKLTRQIIQDFDAERPLKSIPALQELRQLILSAEHVNEKEFKHWSAVKLKEIEELLIACLGLRIDFYTESQHLVPGQEKTIKLSLSFPYVETIQGTFIFNLGGVKFQHQISSRYWDTTITLQIPESLKNAYSHPFWLKNPLQGGLFGLEAIENLLKQESKPLFPLEIYCHFSVNQKKTFNINVSKPLEYKFIDPSRGEIYQPVFAVPPVVVIPEDDKLFLPATSEGLLYERKLNVMLKNFTGNSKGKIHVNAPVGYIITPAIVDFDFKNNETSSLQFTLKRNEKNPDTLSQVAHINFFCSIENSTIQQSDLSYKKISYPHIPDQLLLPKASINIHEIPVNPVTFGKIGYISGSGDKVLSSLKQLGFDIEELSKETLLSEEKLKEYKTIITGIRAYNMREDMGDYKNNLMNFVNNGGRMIVQYNTNSRVGPLQNEPGPFPFTISRNRVTDENAEVHFLNPNHRFLNSPYTISKKDFHHWIQERGIYFATDRDSNYQALLSMADPDEELQDGSLIYCSYGKGTFIYTGLAFFRQLPAGHPGAFKLFANLMYSK